MAHCPLPFSQAVWASIFLAKPLPRPAVSTLTQTVPTGQLSLNSTDGVDTCMAVDSTDSFDMLNPWQAQMDATTVGDFMELGALGVPHCVSRTPSLCSSEGSYSDITQSAGFTPTQESPSLLPRKRRRGQDPWLSHDHHSQARIA